MYVCMCYSLRKLGLSLFILALCSYGFCRDISELLYLGKVSAHFVYQQNKTNKQTLWVSALQPIRYCRLQTAEQKGTDCCKIIFHFKSSVLPLQSKNQWQLVFQLCLQPIHYLPTLWLCHGLADMPLS
jgi:hypothetical protein